METSNLALESARPEANAAFMRRVLETSPLITYVFDLVENRCIYISQQAFEQLGHRPEEIYRLGGRFFSELIHPEDQARMPELLRRWETATDSDILSVEYRMRDKNGRWRWYIGSDSVFQRQADGRVWQITGSAKDITEIKETQQALRASEERLRACVANTPNVAVQWYDETGRVLFWNAASEHVFGWAAEEALGRSLDALIFTPEEAAKFTASLQGIKTSGRPVGPLEFNFRRRDGSRGVCLSTVFSIPEVNGQPCYVCMDVDMTAQKKVELELRQAQKMEVLGRLAGGLAHDFNNILQAIQGFTELSRAQSISAEEREGAMLEVMAASDRAAQMTRQLLAFGRRQPLEIANTDLALLISNLLKMLNRLLGERIRLEFNTEDRLPHVRCDPTQIEQVLMNLCVNSRDAMPEGGLIRISLEECGAPEGAGEGGPFLLLTVADNGMGMDETTQAQVFEPFFTTKSPGKGTGLGLSVVYGIIQQHKGFISVQSQPGTGTKFLIRLPAWPASPQPPAALKKEVAATGAGRTLLVAEDDPALRGLMRRILERAGFVVILAQNGREAVELFRANAGQITLLIFDVVMPEMGGDEAYRRISEIQADLPVLFCSGYNEVFGQVESNLPPLGAFLAKPYRPEDLLKRIGALLGPGAKTHSGG